MISQSQEDTTDMRSRGNRHGPPGGRRISEFLSKYLTIWQALVTTLLTLYTARNFGKLIGLECPEPLANLYKPAFFRATWVTTALDAGFWSAMRIKRKPVRDFCSIIFTLYYLICAEQADEKVRKVRSVVTVDHLRIAWNKPKTPYLSLVTKLMRPRLMRYQPRALLIPRPEGSAYPKEETIRAWLFWDRPLKAMEKQTRVILNFPGGGFVAMDPRTHDDALMAWAGKTGLPVLSLDYRKAPEKPYPYALDECFDAYKMIVQSKGFCFGLSGEVLPSIVLSGDSAGGNLAASITLMILESGSTDTRRWQGEDALPPPDGLVLMYPSLDVNIGNWMTDEQMSLIRDRGMRKTNRRILSRKNSEYQRMDPSTPIPSDDEDEDPSPPSALRDDENQQEEGTRKIFATTANGQPASLPRPKTKSHIRTHPTTILPRTRIAVPSLLTYVTDRVLTPEMLRAMIILYIGPHSRPDFSTDYLLSPVLAPEQLLARFPKTYFLTGERDPLVDDTVIMAGRIRAAKRAAWEHGEELGLLSRDERRRGWKDSDAVEVRLLEGISHGFLQMAGLFPEAWNHIYMIGRWYEELFAAVDARAGNAGTSASGSGKTNGKLKQDQRHHRRSGTASSWDDEADTPLEMTRSSRSNAPSLTLSTSQKRRSEDMEDGEISPHSTEPNTPGEDAENSLSKTHPLGRRKKSAVSLGSEDDFLGRRMRGLVSGLTRGSGET